MRPLDGGSVNFPFPLVFLHVPLRPMFSQAPSLLVFSRVPFAQVFNQAALSPASFYRDSSLLASNPFAGTVRQTDWSSGDDLLPPAGNSEAGV